MNETTPVQKLGEMLLVTVRADLADSDILQLRREVARSVRKHAAKWVLLDFSQVDVCDTYFGRFIHSMSEMARLVGAEAIVCGLSNPVVETLVEMGLEFHGLRITLDVDSALELTRERR